MPGQVPAAAPPLAGPESTGSILVSLWYDSSMSGTNHLVAVRAAAREVKAAEAKRRQAKQQLAEAVRAANSAGIRPKLLQQESGLPRATYYRVLRGGDH